MLEAWHIILDLLDLVQIQLANFTLQLIGTFGQNFPHVLTIKA
jgi:hypothetical protein